MKKTITTLAVCIPMLTACLEDQPRIVQVPSGPNYGVNQGQAAEQNILPVLSALPNYKAPKCHSESVAVQYEEQVPKVVPNDARKEQSVGGALIGGLIGLAMGDTIGTAAAIFGLVGGMAAGGNLAGETPSATKTIMTTETRTRYEQQEKCEDLSEAQREILNYTVTFIYKGQPVSTVMPYNPGANLVLGMAGNIGR